MLIQTAVFVLAFLFAPKRRAADAPHESAAARESADPLWVKGLPRLRKRTAALADQIFEPARQRDV